MDSLERLMRVTPLQTSLSSSQGARRALVHASLTSALGRKARHLTGTFCLTGDTMEGIIQCLVFLKAFSVSLFLLLRGRRLKLLKKLFFLFYFCFIRCFFFCCWAERWLMKIIYKSRGFYRLNQNNKKTNVLFCTL